MKPELVDATLRRRSSVDKVTQPDGASQEILVIFHHFHFDKFSFLFFRNLISQMNSLGKHLQVVTSPKFIPLLLTTSVKTR